MRKIFERRSFETNEFLQSYKDLTAYTINHFYKIRIYFLFHVNFGLYWSNLGGRVLTKLTVSLSITTGPDSGLVHVLFDEAHGGLNFSQGYMYLWTVTNILHNVC